MNIQLSQKQKKLLPSEGRPISSRLPTEPTPCAGKPHIIFVKLFKIWKDFWSPLRRRANILVIPVFYLQNE